MTERPYELIDLASDERLSLRRMTDAQAKRSNDRARDEDVFERWYPLPGYGTPAPVTSAVSR